MRNLKAIKFISVFSILFLMSVKMFAQSDVPRETKAITYPQDEDISVQFRGTTRFPRMKGTAEVERTRKNGTEIKLTVSKMPRPYELGAGYATYVLWAISPDGQIDNLGEIKRRGFFEFDSKISVTTPLQTFALIVTAEPHFLVKTPSRAVMLENLNPYAKNGRTVATTTSIQYFGNSSDYFRDARTPEIADVDYKNTPPSILQAQQAVALAKYAGAQRDAQEELNEAETLLQNAVNAWKAERDEDTVDIAARRAISSAVKAESTAAVRKDAREKRNERSKRDAEIDKAEDKFIQAQDEITSIRSELARETRNRELAERDALNYSNQVKDLQDENSRLWAEAERVKIQLAKIEGEKLAIEKRQERAEKLDRIRDNEDVLIKSLSRFGAVDKNERGIVLILPENYWTGNRVSSFTENGETNLNQLGEVLANSVDYKVMVEAHTDNKGTPDELKLLTDERAQAISDKMTSYGVNRDRISAEGFGGTLPVVPNSTAKNRSKNQRINVILVPNIE